MKLLFDSKLEILLLCANENVQLFFANFKGIKRPSGGKLLGNIFVNRLKKKKKNTVLKGSVHGTMIQLKEGNLMLKVDFPDLGKLSNLQFVELMQKMQKPFVLFILIKNIYFFLLKPNIDSVKIGFNRKK